MKAQGFDVVELAAEDWGWMVEIRSEAFPLWIGCGNLDGEPDGYLCFIEPSRPFVRKFLFKKIPTVGVVTRVRDALEMMLSNERYIQDIRWWGKEEFEN